MIHVFNNFRQLSGYLKSRVVWGTLVATLILVAVFLWQPAPVRKVLQLSGNLGPALDRFELTGQRNRTEHAEIFDTRGFAWPASFHLRRLPPFLLLVPWGPLTKGSKSVSQSAACKVWKR